MKWFIIIGIVLGLYFYGKSREVNYENKNEVGNPKSTDLTLNLGTFNYYLEPDEVCEFIQEDVAWYEYLVSENLWDVKAAGTLYLTNKKLILYDKGFSNLWTKLSVEGDYPEMVYYFPTKDIVDVQRRVMGGLRGIQVSTNNKQCILAPSHRKYGGRRTPITNEYPQLTKLGERLIINKHKPEIDRLLKKIDTMERERIEIKRRHNL